MEFREVVRRRRMVRNYTDQPVDPASVTRLLEAARRAPSAGFSQGQAFVVITERKRRQRIADLAGEHEYVAKGFDPWISKAPVHIVVCVSEQVYRQRYDEPDKNPDGTAQGWPVPYWWVDAGASLMLLLLAAVDEGLAAGFLGSHAMPELERAVGLPDHMRAIGVVTIGHAAPDRPSGSLRRGHKPWIEIVHREQWGGQDETDASH
ncbi:MAG TPA: nitroreductase family protein [Acidimicrobiia bacterium]|nr:nitroreductase family protein [Acidimicrobiia bacterium]